MTFRLCALVLLVSLLAGCHKVASYHSTSRDAGSDLALVVDRGSVADLVRVDGAGDGAADTTVDAPLGDLAATDVGPPISTLVQSGLAGFAASATSTLSAPLPATISPPNAFVWCSFRTRNSEPYHAATCQLRKRQLEIAVGNGAAVTSVRFYIVQHRTLKVQSNSHRFSAGATSVKITLPRAVTLSRSFVIATGRVDSSDRVEDSERTVTAQLVSSTELLITRDSKLRQADIEWQVVEVMGARVQHGLTTLKSGNSSAPATLSKVDPARSFFVFNARASAATGGVEGNYLVRALLTSPTSLQFERGKAASATVTISWSVIELPSSMRVLHGSNALNKTALQRDESPAAVDSSRALPLHSAMISGSSSSSELDSGSLTAGFLSNNALRFSRADTGTVASYGWSVVEWAK